MVRIISGLPGSACVPAWVHCPRDSPALKAVGSQPTCSLCDTARPGEERGREPPEKRAASGVAPGLLSRAPPWTVAFAARPREEAAGALFPYPSWVVRLRASLTHASPSHAPHNQRAAAFFLFLCLLFRSLSPPFCSASSWLCSLFSLRPLCLRRFLWSCFSSSRSSPAICLPSPPHPALLSFVFCLKF